MMRLKVVLAAVLVFTLIPGVASADDAQAAAAGKSAAPGSGGRFQRALGAPTIPRAGGGKAKSRKKAAKKGSKSAASKKNAESKYKSRELVENTETSYRFDENGNPVTSAPKKKFSAKAGAQKSSSASDKKDDKPGACSADEPCTVKNSDADAL